MKVFRLIVMPANHKLHFILFVFISLLMWECVYAQMEGKSWSDIVNCEKLTHCGEKIIDLAQTDIPLLSDLILFEINVHRQAHNMKPLVNDLLLTEAAQIHAEEMTQRNFTDHVNRHTPKLKTLLLRIQSVGGGFNVFAENIALYYPFAIDNNTYSYTETDGKFIFMDENSHAIVPMTYCDLADALVNGWIDSPGHRDNILNPTYEFSGIAFKLSHAFGFNSQLPFFRFVQVFGGRQQH